MSKYIITFSFLVFGIVFGENIKEEDSLFVKTKSENIIFDDTSSSVTTFRVKPVAPELINSKKEFKPKNYSFFKSFQKKILNISNNNYKISDVYRVYKIRNHYQLLQKKRIKK